MDRPPPGSPAQPLLRPVRLADLRLPNRVVMAPMTRARADNDGLAPTRLHAAYYSQRAGAGLIVTEATWVSPRAVGALHVPGIYSREQTAGWRGVTDAVHARGGRIVLQLWHAGAASHPAHLGGQLPAGPSAVNPRQRTFTPAGFKDTLTPRAMGADDIRATVADFHTAAENARRAGFDGVEIAALPPYLISQFLSPRLNRRTDAYGHGRAGRRLLLAEIIDAVADPWEGRRTGVRLGPYLRAGDQFPADGETFTEHDELAAELNDHPLAYLHLRGPDPATTGAAPDREAVARCRQHFHGPLIANNGYGRETANALIAGGTADAVSFATHFIANPDLVTAFATGRTPAAPDRSTYYTAGPEGYTDHRTPAAGPPARLSRSPQELPRVRGGRSRPGWRPA